VGALFATRVKKEGVMKKGFTLVEIMIVVAIIGLLAAIAIPSFMKARENSRKNACVNNLRQIEGAKEQWAMENNLGQGAGTSGNTATINNYIKKNPVCPAGGTYDYTTVGANPTCSYNNNHSL
jgi:prepilin-type N-terminal cleavage/methylation domain-containing protein